ncbi:MAG: DUF2254 domain-containing protein [Polaromonas sp.]|uniref:DUF2254 domain-containing protein n=1 Tax=Polaromonas sp. TaxID=1869339 RepID=UPI0024880C16|nr:DUF2254 domain-containing protein [Polaromonas sp.]MDI1270639.1 DUF2254 domain-containing protein [Polaromonas sp.]
MTEKLIYLLQRVMRKTWVRCVLFSLMAILAIGMSMLLGPSIPEDVAVKLGADAIGSILNIIATSMLTVAIFSASTMVSSFTAVASSATPRASQLMIEDATIQNTLATFVGAFLYSVIALIGLRAHIYGGGGRLVLFGFTITILLIVVVVLLRWIDYLSVLGRMGETLQRVEKATTKAMDQRLSRPCLGGKPLRRGSQGRYTLLASETGFVQHVSMDILQKLAEENDDTLYVHVLPGAFIEPSTLIISSDRAMDEARCKAMHNAVLIGASRTFDHDPRFGLVVLGEIATRALSPGVNDPGTALDVMATAVRTLAHWVQHLHSDSGTAELLFDRVNAPPLDEAGMLDDVFLPLARYGAGAAEVGLQLQRTLGAIRRLRHPEFDAATQRLSRYAIARAVHANLFEMDVQGLREAAEDVQQAAPA